MDIFFSDDCKVLLHQMKHQEKQLIRKRRWLMGLPLSKSLKKLKSPSLKNKSLPESLLREDDVFYETAKAFVERGFAASNFRREHPIAQDINMQLLKLTSSSRVLDDFTNKGLCLLAEILTGGSVTFDKTRPKMKMVIRDHLPGLLNDINAKTCPMEMVKQLSHLLNDPHNFHNNRASLLTPTSLSQLANKILDGLENLPGKTISVMHKKLIGAQGGMAELQPPTQKRHRLRLVEQVRATSRKMLSELGDGANKLQEPLCKAMSVAALSLNLLKDSQDTSAMEFCHFLPEVAYLQNEIATAIRILDKVDSAKLKTLYLALAPNEEIPKRSLKQNTKELLTEYLFECGDMDYIPKSLLNALDIVNKLPQKSCYYCSSKEKSKDEVECLLRLSAQLKQIIWDLIPDHELDHDFTDAYMGESEENYDDVEQPSYLNISHSNGFTYNYSDDLTEGIGESNLTDFKFPASTTKAEDKIDTDSGSSAVSISFHSPKEEIFLSEKKSTYRNCYLAIQEICDETSMVAYHFIGNILGELAQASGLVLDNSDELYLGGNGMKY